MRSWYHVGRPSMLLGKTFLGATGIPIEKMARVSTMLADWLPEPLTVAAWKVRSLTFGAYMGAKFGELILPVRNCAPSLTVRCLCQAHVKRQSREQTRDRFRSRTSLPNARRWPH